MPSCFVIQPFDKGLFDARYNDVFEAAIRAAGYIAYRVDCDPGASIPIDEITKQIEAADACFAEITRDNPNVWFELGYALALRKEVCMACSTEREGKFPFDVQHRLITTYAVRSTSDFEKAKQAITERLIAISKKVANYAKLEESQPIRTLSGLSHNEISCLCAIIGGKSDPADVISSNVISSEMSKMGFNRVAAQIALHKLESKGMIFSNLAEGYDEAERERYKYTVYQITPDGMNWIAENEEVLQLTLFPS